MLREKGSEVVHIALYCTQVIYIAKKTSLLVEKEEGRRYNIYQALRPEIDTKTTKGLANC